jgi:hypothetical protein
MLTFFKADSLLTVELGQSPKPATGQEQSFVGYPTHLVQLYRRVHPG